RAPGPRGLAPGTRRRQDGQETRGIDGLQQVFVEARLERPLPVLLLTIAAERDQPRAVVQLRADLPSDLVAVDPGQTDVDQHGVGLELDGHLYTADAVGCLVDVCCRRLDTATRN